ncbi:gluconate 2-dehydrogenase subunit 3 family protein [Halosimplex halophilum]|uniref:gluconate 2-dehydrogenase subunit 3 family protein n=1 Tax=Halosimplex halophilum TaxID=2559572 RepID=UPI00107F8219|nr:gluconate 2-dehydrogenase subunit 3 family protein [Halosimplex halophilum]
MELTRRDAVAALAAIGIGGGVVYGAFEFADRGVSDGTPSGTEDPDSLLETTVALAEVVYPPEVTEVEPFVREFVSGRIEDDDRHTAMVDAADALDARARSEYSASFYELDPEEGDALLETLGMSEVDPDPEGDERERIRYYLVNELLYGLLRSPKGGQLVGLENPPGHPGGLEAYQQGPDR